MESLSLKLDQAKAVVSLSLSVRSVRWHHPVRGTIFSGYDADGALHVVRVNPSRCASVGCKFEKGQIWHIEGEWEHYNEVDQILALKCFLLKPVHGRLLVYYLKETFTGVGPKRAAKLFDHFDQQGVSVADVLDRRDITALLEILPSVEVAEQLVEEWHEKMIETQIIRGLEVLGLPTRLANKLMSLWGGKVLEVIDANPYFLLALVSWCKVDNVAHRCGIGARDKRRLIGAVEAALYRRLVDMHTLTRHVQLRTRVINLLNEPVTGHCWPRAGVQTGEDAMSLALEVGVLAGNRKTGYQTASTAHMEGDLADRINAMIAGENPKQKSLSDINGAVQGDVWRKLEEALFDGYYLRDMFAAYEQANHKLTQQQRDAVAAVIERQLFVIAGGAGTGKTSMLRVIHAVVRGKGGTVHQMTFTGRAIERMREMTGHDATTIAKFLRDVRMKKITVTHNDLVIVDEASVIGLSTLYQIVDALPQGTHLLLVGDPGQLPPIEFGLTFHVLARPNSMVPKIELTKVHPQAAETNIPQVAADVRNGVVPVLGHYQGRHDGLTFVPCEPEAMVKRMFEIQDELGGINEAQILGVVKGGEAGTQVTNRRFHQWLAEQHKSDVLIGEDFALGDPVIYLENDVNRELYNGTFGVITGISSDDINPGLLCQFEGKDHVDFIAAEHLYKIALAYAVTIYKAQGARFKRVIVPILKSRLLDRRMLYAAITRAHQQVVFVGERLLFDEAVIAPPSTPWRQVRFKI